jgi:hypothetical protein
MEETLRRLDICIDVSDIRSIVITIGVESNYGGRADSLDIQIVAIVYRIYGWR